MDDYSPFIQAKNLNGKVALNALPPEAWQTMGAQVGDSKALWRRVPFLKRGIDVVAQATADLPFTFSRAGEVITESGSYEDPTDGLLPYPAQMFSLIASSLMIYGEAYLFIERNLVRPVGLQWLAPTSIKPVYHKESDRRAGVKAGDVAYFERVIENKKLRLEVEDVLYVWMPDPDIENGPPLTSAVDAAMLAAGSAESVDEFATKFFKSGAIKRTLFTLPVNVVEAEKSRFKRWVSRLFRGVDSAWGEAVFFADTVKPEVIGEGLESLENKDFSDRVREDIATALGVPHSILFSNAANYATAEQDYRNLYTLTVSPLANLIAQAFNDQLFSKLQKSKTLELRFDHTALDVFQEDEEDRTGALINLINGMAGASPDIVILSMQMLGVELPAGMDWDELRAILEAERDRREERAAEIAQSGQNDQGGPQQIPVASGTQPPGDEDDKALSPLAVDLDKWKRKALKSLDKGKSANVPFTSEYIDAASRVLIAELLEGAGTPEDVEEVFNVAV